MDDKIKLEATDGHAKHRGFKGAPLKPQVLAPLHLADASILCNTAEDAHEPDMSFTAMGGTYLS